MHEARPLSEASTIADLQRWGRDQLVGPDARRESELLLGHAVERDRAWLYAHADRTVSLPQRTRFEDLIASRARGIPIAQLLGTWGFWTLDLRISPDVLIPRPDTERLVEAALELLAPDTSARILDLGTGSGAIALALASERTQASVFAGDASAAALQIARANALGLGLDRIEFRCGDWYLPFVGERFDLIASNPPYIAADDPHLGRGDLRFEPDSALIGGADGLDAIRVLAAGATRHLLPGGWILIEHGFDQGQAVRELLRDAGLGEVNTLRDIEGRERLTRARSTH